jgi:hypothetical protein
MLRPLGGVYFSQLRHTMALKKVLKLVRISGSLPSQSENRIPQDRGAS